MTDFPWREGMLVVAGIYTILHRHPSRDKVSSCKKKKYDNYNFALLCAGGTSAS